MKRVYMVVVCGMAIFMASAQPPECEIVLAGTKLLSHNELREARHEFVTNVRDHSIDVMIAGLYLLGSGFAGVSEEVSLVSNVAASGLWIVDSVVRTVAAQRKFAAAKRSQVADFSEVVVYQ